MSQQSQQSVDSGEEEDLPVLKYARKHGVALNHLADTRPLDQVQALQAQVPDLIADDSPVPQLDFGAVTAKFTINERLTVSRESAKLTSSIQREAPSVDYILPLIDVREAKKFKVEEPILRTDNELDCQAFARRDGFEPALTEIQLPREYVNEENGDGLSIPAHLWDLGKETLEKLKTEKLMVTKDILTYLGGIVKDEKEEFTEANEEKVWNSLQNYERSNALEPVTPPLLPSDPQHAPYEPTSSELDVPLLSDPPSLIGAELQAIEEKLFEQDVPTPIRNAEARTGNISSPSTLKDFDGVTGDVDRKATKPLKLEDLKVEEILTPPRPAVAISKDIHFNTIMETIPSLSPPRPTPDMFQERYFEEAFGDADKKAMRMVEQEKLPPEESTKARVTEPIIDLSLPEPPWGQIERHRNSAALETIQKDMVRLAIGNTSFELKGMKDINHKLPWNLFSRWKPDVLLDGPGFVEKDIWKQLVYDQKGERIIDSSNFTWKPQGLKALDDEAEDEEIEMGLFEDEAMNSEQQPVTMSAAVENFLKKNALQQQGAPDAANLKRKSMASSTRSDILNTLSGPSVLIGGDFSAADEMNNFLALRGSKRQKLGDSSYFTTTKTSAQPKPAAIPAQPLAEQTEIMKIDTPNITLPSPKLNPPPYPVFVIIASTLLRQRSLIRQVESLFPTLNLTERDFAKHNTTSWEGPGKVTRSPIISPLASEADLAVSASTGIILTTLAKVRQKPLPGQKGKAAIRERVESVNMRYEKLIVLVNEGGSIAQELSESDAMALTEFMAFACSLPGCVRVHYIAGDESEMGKWLTYHIIKHAPSTAKEAQNTTLLEDETHWELFLRRAGLNAFAAQMIISQLKAPEVEVEVELDKPDARVYGLLAFVQMGSEERVKMFAGLCGGSKVLERVGRVVDARWE